MAIKAGTNGIKTNTLQALVKMLAWFSTNKDVLDDLIEVSESLSDMLTWFTTNKDALDDLIEGAPYEPKTQVAAAPKRKTTKAGDQ